MKLKKTLTTLGLTCFLMMLFSLTALALSGDWKEGDYGWWYEYSDGSYPKGGIYSIDDKYYAFDKHGWMKSNEWVQTNSGNWYYFTGSGVMATDQWIGDYYVGSDGLMLTDTWTPDGYYVDSSGKYVESKGKQGNYNDSGEYYTIDGNWDNRDQSGYSKDKRVDLWVEVDPGDAYIGSMDFGLYMSSGTPYSLYDSANPNGDSLKIGSADGYKWGCRSTISDKWYDMTYNGKDTITLEWRTSGWTSSGKLIFKRRSGGRLLYTGNGTGAVG